MQIEIVQETLVRCSVATVKVANLYRMTTNKYFIVSIHGGENTSIAEPSKQGLRSLPTRGSIAISKLNTLSSIAFLLRKSFILNKPSQAVGWQLCNVLRDLFIRSYKPALIVNQNNYILIVFLHHLCSMILYLGLSSATVKCLLILCGGKWVNQCRKYAIAHDSSQTTY